MNSKSRPPGPRAFDARELARLLSDDRELMDRFKRAAEAGAIRAASTDKGHRTVVEDASLVDAILTADASLRHFDPPGA